MVHSTENAQGSSLAITAAETTGSIMMVDTDGDPVPVWATKHGHGKAGAAQDNAAFNDFNLPRGEDWIVSEL
jgi:hypothetical protein